MVRGFLERFLSHPADRVALRLDADMAGDGPRTISYGGLWRRGAEAAGRLRELGVVAGDRVAIQLENSLDLLDAHLGCMALGAVRVPLNAHYKAAELRPILDDAAPTLVVARDPARLPPGARHVPRLEPGTPVDAWPSAGPTALLFTSGTTGRAKGVPQTWEMWATNLDALEDRWRLSADDRLRLVLPLFHTHGLVVGLHGVWLRGACADVGARFEPGALAPGVTHFYGVPTYYHRWLPSLTREHLPDVRLLVSGSDGLGAAVSDAVYAATGHRILERYGMTETVMITSNPFDGPRRAGTVGTPLGGVDVRIVADEVQVRGPSVFGGYWPHADPGAFTADGWFRTGDAGAWDPDGYLRIVGRQKDLVIVGGVNVSPAEVEAVLREVAGVAEVGVCGLPDADLGEIVAAAVVLANGARPEDVTRAIDRAAAELSGLKRPKRLAFVSALPRSPLGKLMRARLRADAFGE